MVSTPTTTEIVKEVVAEVKAEPAKAVEAQTKPEVVSIDLSAPAHIGKPSQTQAEEALRLSAKLVQLETFIAYAQQNKIEWGEVDADILKHFNKGELPAAGYFIYKNIKLCLPNTAEDLARRDNMNCHQVLFPQESYMKVGIRAGS